MELECVRCGHKWKKRGKRPPRLCPHCKRDWRGDKRLTQKQQRVMYLYRQLGAALRDADVWEDEKEMEERLPL